MADDDLFKSAALPDGEYAIVEFLGHRTLIGRVAEVERFGTKMLQMEPIFQGRLLPAILHGGGSIYAMTICTREIAGARAPTQTWQIPDSLRSTLPLAEIEADPERPEDTADDDDMPF